jgi:hypothetical protein
MIDLETLYFIDNVKQRVELDLGFVPFVLGYRVDGNTCTGI